MLEGKNMVKGKKLFSETMETALGIKDFEKAQELLSKKKEKKLNMLQHHMGK